MLSTINKSLLELVTSQEVDDLIIEQELKEKGYKFHYFIDQVDIDKYSFPFGLVANENFDQRENRSIELVTDEQIAYDYLINVREEKLLLFDEHRDELEGLQRKIDRVKNLGLALVDSYKIQSEYFIEMSKGKAITFEAWSKNQQLTSELNVSLLISIALGSLRTNIEILNKLIENKLISKDNEYQNLGLNTSITDLKSCKPKDITEKLFDLLIDSYNNSPQRLIAKYNKCKVFDRVLCINNKGNKNKDVFLLLSSAKSINERLPKLANELGIGLSFENIELNPIRTIQQIYLQLLLEEKESKSEELKKIREIIILKEKNNSTQIKELVNELITRYFENSLSKLREGYENVSLLLKIENYRKLFSEALKGNKLSNQKIISNSILELLKIAEATQELESLKSINLTSIEYVRDYNQILKSALNEINFGNKYLKAFAGQDYIENPYHTIPFVFFEKGSENFKEVIKKIVILATEASQDNFNSRKLLESINESFVLLYHRTLPSEEERVIMLLILLMIKNNDNDNPDELAYYWINEILTTEKIDNLWINDFKYIKSWVCRRIKKYPESIEICNEVLSTNINDARFYHSLYLNHYCIYRDTNNVKELDKALDFCNKSYNLYQKKFNENNSISINKTIAANLNSLSYLNTLVYKEDSSKIENLISARNFLNLLKQIEPSYFFNFPEFLHTEALLELQEYKYNKDVSKLSYGIQAIEKAIRIKQKDEYFQLKDELNQLLTAVLR